MTVEIRQLIIRAVAEPASERREAQDTAPPPPARVAAVDRDAIVTECVRKVLRTLARRRER
ncbi:hypothetical protein G6O69_36000 [Pseudenhygromyxa sp. WMMC2535]|uniref:DUF5908 family protein n=1 Tax=Pseudenhygromyxa sp. WMMC2535 TaxID=2712867 RepID=UPI001557EFBE|nr:DUF5908 family protein [Pseudenhygromyxa sp. WMMC2535]NVB43284.1 hypothetical protein [Pseudenhygromyxa sp. WMMC2535]